MRIFTINSIVISLLLPVIGFAQGNQRGNPADNLMRQFDANQDGQITVAEVQTRQKQHFQQLDKDKNGFLSETEFKPAGGPPPGHQRGQGNQPQPPKNDQANAAQPRKDQKNPPQSPFQRLDTNRDNQISFAEFTAQHPIFDRFDRNKDGVITQQEMAQRPNK